MIDVYALYQLAGLPAPRWVCEVGVNAPDKCSVKAFIEEGVPALLVEPLPWLAQQLRDAFPASDVREGAVGAASGSVVLYDRGEGSWIDDVPAHGAPDEHPGHSGMTRAGFEEQFKRVVECWTFDQLDNGMLDVLCVDTEGAEWFVLNRMVSRPFLVRVETHFTHSGYCNPFTDEIFAAMKDWGYSVLVQDVSDTLWIRKDLPRCTE
jgi:hypothetical protein